MSIYAICLSPILLYYDSCLFFFTDTSTTEIYTLSLHDALPILTGRLGDEAENGERRDGLAAPRLAHDAERLDRKSTRLNSSHVAISYAVFCLKKKKKKS